MVSETEKRMFAYILVVLAVYIYFAVPFLNGYALSNFIITYTAFIFGYTFMILKFVVGINPLEDRNKFLAWILIFLATDIFMFPLLITSEQVLTLPPEAKMSSDIYIYTLLPLGLPHAIKYFLTYVLLPTIFLYLARNLMTKREFSSAIKQAV